jgi:transcriptional regulator with XRE-family HTH domain
VSTFAEELRRYRRARGLTQGELAEQAQLSERAISDLERGLKVPQRGTVQMLAEALALSPEEAQEFDKVARMPADKRAPAVARTTNLPTERPPLFGRDRDTAGVCEALVRTDGCLVTLVGPGGVGKTRLALWVADKLHEAHPDGVWLVDLSAVTGADRVTTTVADALGIRVELALAGR